MQAPDNFLSSLRVVTRRDSSFVRPPQSTTSGASHCAGVARKESTVNLRAPASRVCQRSAYGLTQNDAVSTEAVPFSVSVKLKSRSEPQGGNSAINCGMRTFT